MNSKSNSRFRLPVGEHIVLSTNTGRNATVLRQALESQGFVCVNAPTVRAVVDAIKTDASLVVITEEVLTTEKKIRDLTQCLNNQPEWSDIPVIMLLKDCRRFPSCMAFLRNADYYGSLILLEMPIKKHEFISVVRSCLQNRQQQYVLRDTLYQLRESNQALENFSYMVAHELRNPLNATVGSLEMLTKDNSLNTMARKFARIAYRSARNLDRTIQAMLNYGKLKARENITFESVDMNLVVEQAVSNLEQVIANRQIKINWNQLPTVRGNEQLLIQLISNLIKNAIVHNTPDSLEINISAQWQGQRWQLCVTDNGSGISANNQEKIFALFERADSSQAQGSGIGLALCRRIVELHQGIIGVRAQPNQGSTFYFDLAAARK
jgi:signal transduction histidine kinase